jgi:hypothetical protein
LEAGVTFRKLAPAIILMTWCAGLASGQIGGSGVSCQVGSAVPSNIRVEGYAELVADIVLVCNGGTALTAPSGSAAATASSPNAIPQMSVTANFATAVTSRILASGGLSEALLLVDEPGNTALTTYGARLPISVCPTPMATIWQSAASPGCQEWVGNIGGNSNVPVLSTRGRTNGTPGYNAFPGVVSGSTVTFNGVPMLPPGAGEESRIFRITNVRVNASALASDSLGTIAATVFETGVQASFIYPSGGSSVTTAYAVSHLYSSLEDSKDASVLSPSTISSNAGAGLSKAPTVLGYLRFLEGLANTFRTRVDPRLTGSGQSAAAEQDIPGAIYNSESGFTPYIDKKPQYFGGNKTYIPGLANSGTRVKAVFQNIPSGATIYVGTGSGANTSSGMRVRMVSSPHAGERASLVAPTVTVGGVGFVALVPSGGSATATWEVMSVPNQDQPGNHFDIPVAVYAAAGGVPPGTVTVDMSYAPTISDVLPSQFMPEFAAGQAQSHPIGLQSHVGTPVRAVTARGMLAAPVPSSLILILCGLGALLLFAAGRKVAAR